MTRLTQTRSIRILGVVVALAASSAAACSTAASVTPQPATATQTARPSGPLPIRAGLATPGSYNTTAFRPPLTLTITSDGWLFRFEDDDDEMAVGRGDGVEILGGRVSKVVDPGTHTSVDAPDDLVDWFESHPEFDAEPPKAVTVAGLTGQSIDLRPKGRADIEIFSYPTGDQRIPAGTRARAWVLPYEGPDLVFTGLAPEGSFEQALPDVEAIIGSIEIGAPS